MNTPYDADGIDDIRALARDCYGLTGRFERLPGENENYVIITGGDADGAGGDERGERFVLKAEVLADRDEAELVARAGLERFVAARVHEAAVGLEVPRVLPTKTGDTLARHAAAPAIRARLFTFVPGTAWCDTQPTGDAIYRQLGEIVGRIDVALAGKTHPAARRTHPWDLANADRHREKIALIADAERRRILEWTFHLFAAWAKPDLDAFPRSIVHGDVNDENVLLTGDRITGLLDFGDCLDNPTICELAVTLAYAMLGASDPLHVGAQVVRGYHAVRPLSKTELAALFPLVCARLSATVTIAAERRCVAPNHPTWFDTEDRAWRLLETLEQITPATAGTALAAETGIDPHAGYGRPGAELLARRRARIGPSLSIAYRQHLKIVRGRGQYLFDEHGRPFLDMVNNVCHVGHCHPYVVAAGHRQMAILNTNTRYLYDGLTDYADRLCATLPPSLDTCYFVNSGSEANELAMRLASAATGHDDFLVVDGAYHGHTARLIAMSPYKFMGKGGAGRPEPWVHVVPIPDGYRGEHKGQGRETGIAYGDEVGRVIASIGRPVAGFICESLVSCGGQVIPPAGYFETAYRHVRAAGGVCIADEVQVGFGRVGTHFWAFDMQEVEPDIVVLGKPIGNGHPMAAVVTTRAIADAFANGMEFFATFGGNPVSCAIGEAVLDVIEHEQLQSHALAVGTRLRDGVTDLMNKHPMIGDVRGAGLFVGIEFVRDRDTLEPATEEAADLANRLKARGILLSTDGPFDNVLKIKPPMVLTADDVDMVVRTLDDELRARR